ncbi:unannotated protein [freshwater metagenome]|uniref:Unannotated protein n=1 Tax=freshwater metagenome TaxID=449393 RepID=A0A6J6BWN9_9ZZZZ
MVRLVWFEEQKGLGSVGCDAVDKLLRMKKWITGSHDSLYAEPPSSGVIWMESITLPWVMAQNNFWLDSADDGRDLSSSGPVGLKLTINLTQEHNTCSTQNRGRFTLFDFAQLNELGLIHAPIPGAF